MKTFYPIDFCENVPINGTVLNLRGRGTDPDKPVLLFLHGGPGVCDRHWVLKYQSALAEDCTMICYDQRGAGKSYTSLQAKEKMTVSLMVEDARAVIAYLQERFHKERISIVGHSWGSCLGTLLAQRYPDCIDTYVGMGQLANGPENERISYEFVLAEATKRKDEKALRNLARIGAPQNGLYRSLEDLQVQRDYMTKFGGGGYKESESLLKSLIIPLILSPEYSLFDLPKYAKGAYYNLRQLWEEVATSNFQKTVTSLKVPVLITQGRHDQNTPSALAEAWFDQLDAPKKDWVWFEESAHSPIKEEPERWGRVIAEKLYGRTFPS
jgi:pimeloyl-ACP methyl ester carboxylesterase